MTKNIHNEMKDSDLLNEELDDVPNLKSLGEQIATVRKMLDCTQAIFAGTLGITPQTLSLIERGNFPLNNNLASKIYFSLYEIINDEETIEMIELERYKLACIEDLMNNLRKYISRLNVHLRDTVKDFLSSKED